MTQRNKKSSLKFLHLSELLFVSFAQVVFTTLSLVGSEWDSWIRHCCGYNTVSRLGHCIDTTMPFRLFDGPAIGSLIFYDEQHCLHFLKTVFRHLALTNPPG
jgi:hypothetical protein